MKRHGSGTAQGLSRPPAGIGEFQGSPVLECPLMYQDEFLGVLCIALRRASDFEEYKEFITSLAIVASGAIHRIKERESDKEPNTVEVLHLGLKQWDPDGYELSRAAKETGIAFAREQQLAEREIKDAGDACLLAGYDVSLLSGLSLRPSLQQTLEELQLLRGKRAGKRTRPAQAAPPRWPRLRSTA
ncbi:hypothetical protein N6H14_13625 [Paenibacillus sp. CC-CFT747]|nr:hypothetical protein N6H14_13625 [Paenibacillus sp. CC-CFT747]